METVKSEVIFLFGAGASVDADIPDTYSFVNEFKESIKLNEKISKLLLSILTILEQTNRKKNRERIDADIEQVLETLRRLINRENDQLLEFYENKKELIECNNDDLINLLHLLEDFIREKVIIKDEKKLNYLKELMKFERPIEIFSTNYDTCIEQLSYTNHLRYTDGFDIYWNPENFERPFDFLHYKMHGSVIWFENEQTKECVKIPVHSFVQGQPIELKLIYGENVRPLIIYPAQKSEYIEPLTELQLIFKKRLCSTSTKVLVVVGYSFRDNYIVHMIWDAARVNKDLTVVLVSPNAQQIYETKLKYINEDNNSLSRIADRVICLPYPFSTVIKILKNHFLSQLYQIRLASQNCREDETNGREAHWEYLVRLSIDAEHSILTEELMNRINKDWMDIEIGSKSSLLYAFKALMHSVIVNDGYQKKWLDIVNQIMRTVFTVEKLTLKGIISSKVAFFYGDQYEIKKLSEDWLRPLLFEKNTKYKLLTPKFEQALDGIKESIKKLEEFNNYLEALSEGISIEDLIEKEVKSENVKKAVMKYQSAFELAKLNQHWDGNHGEPNTLYLEIMKSRLVAFLGGNSFQFTLDEA